MAETFFQYAGITLDIVQTNVVEITTETSSDGVAVTGNRWKLDLNCVFNPQATSYLDGAAVGAVPTRLRGLRAPITLKALEFHLNQPRKVLIYRVGTTTILRSPAVGYTVDADNGPFVKATVVESVVGERTFLVHLQVETVVPACPKTSQGAPSASPVILSHRWKAYEDTDQDFFSTRVIDGEVIFNTAELKRIGRIPDDYRRAFFHRVVPGCKRENIKVWMESDGRTVRYQITDAQKAFGTDSTIGLTRLEAYHTAWVTEGGIVDAMGGAMGPLGPLGMAGDILNLRFGGPVERAERVVDAVTPKFHYHVLARAWGTSNSRRNVLMSQCLGVAVTRIGGVSPFAKNELQITHELSGKWVEVQWTKTYNIAAFVGLIVAPGGGVAPRHLPPYDAAVGGEFRGLFDGSFERIMGNFASTETDGFFTLGGHMIPPNAGGGRGYLPVALTTQALWDACSTIPRAPAGLASDAFAPVRDLTIY